MTKSHLKLLVLFIFQLQMSKSEMNTEARKFDLVILLLITKAFLKGNWGKLRHYNIPRNVKLAEDVRPKATESPVQ